MRRARDMRSGRARLTTLVALSDVLSLLGAIALAAFGGEAFLKGILGVAAHLRLPKMLVAVTLAAFATSSPELTVSTMAALSGKPEIGLGDALGSNVVNVGLILGLALMFGGLSVRYSEIRRDYLLALAVPVFTIFLMRDGMLSRAEGSLLLVLFVLWLGLAIRQVIQHRRNNHAEAAHPDHPGHSWLLLLAGLAGLILAGRLFVTGASGIATSLGIHPYIIGATVVAIGTSLPEMVTTLLARLRGHDDIGLGTLLGSNLFNGLAIVGIAASIHPIHAPVSKVSVALLFGLLTVLLVFPRQDLLYRGHGMVLLLAYALYVFFTLPL